MVFVTRLAAALLMTWGLTANVFAQQTAPAAASPDGPGADEQSQTVPAEQSPPPAPRYQLPVSLERIRKRLERPPALQIEPREMPTFRVEIQERNRLQDILSTLDFGAGLSPAGGLYAAEMQRVMFPTSSNPLRQPYAAFSQPELLTVILETVAGTYLVKKIAGAATKADREAAQKAAREDFRRTILEYCAGQPNNGAGITICEYPPPPIIE